MTKSNNRIAVVGAGLIGRRHVAITAAHAHLDCIIDPSGQAGELASNWGVAWIADLADALNDRDLDGIILATPNQMHVDQALQAIAHRVPVLVEKPIAHDVAEAEKLREAARLADVPVLVGHHRRHSGIIEVAEKIIRNGDLGSIISVQGQFWASKPDDYFDVPWRRQPGAGPIFINLIHDIDLILHLCGDVTQVHAVESSRARGFAVEDSAAIILRFASGAIGTFSVSDAIAAPWSWELTSGEDKAYPQLDQHAYAIGGSKAALTIPDLKLWRHQGGNGWWSPLSTKHFTALDVDPLIRQFHHFMKVVDGVETPKVSAAEGTRTLRVIEAIKTAAGSGLPVSLSEEKEVEFGAIDT